MYEEIHVVISSTNDIKIIKRERVTSGREMVVNNGRIIVARCGTCFGDSHVLYRFNNRKFSMKIKIGGTNVKGTENQRIKLTL